MLINRLEEEIACQRLGTREGRDETRSGMVISEDDAHHMLADANLIFRSQDVRLSEAFPVEERSIRTAEVNDDDEVGVAMNLGVHA